MKARVKATGEIVEVIQVGTKTHLFDLNNVEFIDAPEDYWTRLEHQYAGMTMQGLLSNERCWEENADKIAEVAICYAKELVKGLRIERSN